MEVDIGRTPLLGRFGLGDPFDCPPSQIVCSISSCNLYWSLSIPGKSTPCRASMSVSASGKSGTAVCHVACADNPNRGR